MTYKLTYVDALGLLKYIGDIVLFLLSCVDGKQSEKVKHDAVVKQLVRHCPLGLPDRRLVGSHMGCFPSAC
jgi:hypothetical protein